MKRLITHSAIAQRLIAGFKLRFQVDETQLAKIKEQIQELSKDLKPNSFKDISRLNDDKYIDNSYQLVKNQLPHQGWFQGDGDKAGDYLKSFAHKPEEASKTTEFSELMREWGQDFKNHPPEDCRVVYAGGDDFLGVFYDQKQTGELKAKDCVDFFSTFKTQVWNNKQPEKKPITVSVGFVWTAPGIPQRDVLQHCREAEKSAKSNGRDRIAFRILFNNGNYLEWVCPWQLLESGLLKSYCDREKNLEQKQQNWTHIYNDVAVLESRHAFHNQSTEIALGLLEIYFPTQISTIQQDNWWNIYDTNERLIKTGILGDRQNYCKDGTQEIDSIKIFPIALKQTAWKPFGDDAANELYFGGLESIGFGRCQVTLGGAYQ